MPLDKHSPTSDDVKESAGSLFDSAATSDDLDGNRGNKQHLRPGTWPPSSIGRFSRTAPSAQLTLLTGDDKELPFDE